MKWAFWRRRKPRATGPGRTDARQSEPTARTEESAVDEGGVRVVHAAKLRVRMRRRLIGAAALLLGTAVVVPMMLDPTPRPLPDNIPIDIPSERTPFSPRLSLPSEAPPSAPGASKGLPSVARSAKEGGANKGEAVDEPPSSAAGPEGKASVPAATEGDQPKAGWFVQAAALSSESAARQLSERLSNAGMTAFVERAGTPGSPVYRVRLGPFTSRDAAVKARRHLHALGVGSNVVRVEQAEQ